MAEPARPHVSCTVPARDEAGTLVELHERFARSMRAEGWTYELLIVDDGSEDATWEVVADLARTHPEVGGLRHARPAGIMEAIATGFRASRGEVLCVLDGDLESRPEELVALIARASAGIDMVSGARDHRDRPLDRRLASLALRAVMLATPHRPADFGCGLKAFRRPFVEEVLADDLAGNGLAFAFSLLRAAASHEDVRVSFDDRSHSTHFPPAQLARNLRAFSGMALERPLRAWGRGAPVAAAAALAVGGRRRTLRPAALVALALLATGAAARHESAAARPPGRPGDRATVIDVVGLAEGRGR